MTVHDFREKQARETKKRVPVAAKKAVVAALDAMPSHEHHVAVQNFAATYGVNRSTVYRWVEQEHRGQLKARTPMSMDPELLTYILELLYSFEGNLVKVHQVLVAEGRYDRTYRRLHQQVVAEVNRLVRKAAGEDEYAARMLGTYVSYNVPHRDTEWQVDLVDLCVDVDLGGGETEHVWATVVVDKRTGLTRGWCVTVGQPSASAVAHALVMAITPRTELLTQADGTTLEVEVGGAPVVLRCDNGRQLLSDLVVRLMCEAGTTMDPAPYYAHTTQGAIERWNRDAKRFTAPLWGSSRGSKTIRGKEVRRAGRPVMDVETIERLLIEHIREHDRTPARGQTLSPLELYAAEDVRGDGYRGPVLSEAQLAQFSLRQLPSRGKGFKVERGCVRARTKRWTAMGMSELRGTTVELWQSTVDPNYIEVRAEGRSFQVFPIDDLPPEMVEEIIENRNQLLRQSNKLRKRGAAIAKSRARAEQDITDGLTGTANLEDDDTEENVAAGGGSLIDKLDNAFREDEP